SGEVHGVRCDRTDGLRQGRDEGKAAGAAAAWPVEQVAAHSRTDIWLQVGKLTTRNEELDAAKTRDGVTEGCRIVFKFRAGNQQFHAASQDTACRCATSIQGPRRNRSPLLTFARKQNFEQYLFLPKKHVPRPADCSIL